MDSSRTLNINAEPAAIIRCLLNPTDLKEWWQCHAVVDARVGGVWALGWGENENGHGHAMVITGFVQEIVEGSRFSVYIEPITIVFDVVPDGNGTMMTISQFNFPEGQDADASLETWVSAMAALKSHVEPAEQSAPEPQAPPTTRENPLVGERQTGSKPTVNVRDSNLLFQNYPDAQGGTEEKILDSRGSKSGLYSLEGGQISHAVESVSAPPPRAEGPVSEPAGGFQVLDDGGFPITKPWGVIKSWKKESGFGYVDHPELGDVMFDYDGCDFEPAPGDKVLLLKLKKTWNGKPKCKRIACPDKGSRVDK